MIRALLDTDVILDLVLARTPFVDAAAELWLAHEQRRFAAYLAPITPMNMFYIVRKIKGADIAREAVDILVNTLHVCTIEQQVLRSASAMSMADYEDAVQVATAKSHQLDAVVTRNTDDYANATTPVFSPTDFLKQLSTT